MNWREKLRELLCQMYKYWGGDCANLGLIPTPGIAQVIEEFTKAGLPKMSKEKRAQFELDLQSLQAHLGLAANDLEGEYNSMLINWIADLWDALANQ